MEENKSTTPAKRGRRSTSASIAKKARSTEKKTTENNNQVEDENSIDAKTRKTIDELLAKNKLLANELNTYKVKEDTESDEDAKKDEGNGIDWLSQEIDRLTLLNDELKLKNQKLENDYNKMHEKIINNSVNNSDDVINNVRKMYNDLVRAMRESRGNVRIRPDRLILDFKHYFKFLD